MRPYTLVLAALLGACAATVIPPDDLPLPTPPQPPARVLHVAPKPSSQASQLAAIKRDYQQAERLAYIAVGARNATAASIKAIRSQERRVHILSVTMRAKPAPFLQADIDALASEVAALLALVTDPNPGPP